MGLFGRNGSRSAVITEYTRLALIYDSRWSFYIRATSRETCKRLSLPASGKLLDAGCGTGVLLNLVATRYPDATLVGIDPVPDMLGVARKRLPAGVELAVAWADRLPFTEKSFDVIVSASMFHYVRQPVITLNEMRRVLRPGGQLVLTDWCADYLSCRLLDRYLGLCNRAHHRIYRQRELLELVAASGFKQLHCERYRINWFWGIMTLSAIRP